MTAIRKQIGARVRELRRARKLTQEQLGERSGLSYKFIGEVERGIANPTIDSLIRITEALDADLSDLIERQRPLIRTLTRDDYLTVREARDSLAAIVRRFRVKGKE